MYLRIIALVLVTCVSLSAQVKKQVRVCRIYVENILLEEAHYSPKGEKIFSVEASTRTRGFWYDTSGRLVKEIDREGELYDIHYYVYDAMDRLTTVNTIESKYIPIDSASARPRQEANPFHSREDLEADKFVKRVESEGLRYASRIYEYGRNGKLAKESECVVGGFCTTQVTYYYNSQDLLDSSGSFTPGTHLPRVAHYDSLGRIICIEDKTQGGYVFNSEKYEWDQAGKLTGIVRWNYREGTRRDSLHYQDGNLVLNESWNPKGFVDVSYAYTYDAAGDRTTSRYEQHQLKQVVIRRYLYEYY